MKPVMQSIEHDPERGMIGNCFQACVASVLELELNDVPHFCEKWDDRWFPYFQQWLQSRGLVSIEVNIKREGCLALTGNLVCILSGNGLSGVMHSVVARFVDGCGFELLHDPHSRGTFFDGNEPEWAMFVLRPL